MMKQQHFSIAFSVPQSPEEVFAAVNDVRLTLGVMLEIGPEGPDRLAADHPLAAHFDVYQWLTVLQEYLVLVLMGQR